MMAVAGPDAENAVHGTHRAADTRADSTPDHASDRTGCAIAPIRALCCAARYADQIIFEGFRPGLPAT